MVAVRSLTRWPLPAVLVWVAAWVLFRGTLGQGAPMVLAIGLASALGVAGSLWGATWWRRLLIAGGFPLSLVLSAPALAPAVGVGSGGMAAWVWLVPLVFLLLVYPLNAWRDAPLFPTPFDALQALPEHAPLPEGAGVLDAGCGLGHGLRALHRAYPQATLHGLEWSWPLRGLCALWCPWARVRRGDIWTANWGLYDMVYLFQRPESMPRAWAKACAQMRPGSWLVSLDFAVEEATPHAHYRASGGKMVWLYRVP